MFILFRWLAIALKRFLIRRAKIALRNFITVQANVFVRSLVMAGVATLMGRRNRMVSVPSMRLDARELENGKDFSRSDDASFLAKGEI